MLDDRKAVSTTFECEGCGKQKDAIIKPIGTQTKTINRCKECGERTVWDEIGWIQIDIE